jgi:hypothetical protein
MMIRAGDGGGGSSAKIPGNLESKHKPTPPPKRLNTFGKIPRDISGLELAAELRLWRDSAFAAVKARLASDLPMPAHFRRAIADMDAGRAPREVALALGMPLETCTRLRSVVYARRQLGVAVKWRASRVEAAR